MPVEVLHVHRSVRRSRTPPGSAFLQGVWGTQWGNGRPTDIPWSRADDLVPRESRHDHPCISEIQTSEWCMALNRNRYGTIPTFGTAHTRVFHGIRTHDILMAYSWDTQGILMEYSWTTHGILMEYTWNTHGIVHGILMAFHRYSMSIT